MLNNLTNETKIIIGVIVVTLVLLVGGIFFLSKSGAPAAGTQAADTVVNIDYSRGQKVGSDSAKVKLVEFGDFQCPACASAEPTVHQILNSNYPDFQFIFRNYPLAQHRNAIPAANLAAYAAENGKFWEIHDRLYASQSEWESLGDPIDYFGTLAREAGLDENAAREAIKNRKYNDVIQADLDEGTTVGVDATPTFYLNGRKVRLQNFSDIVPLIEAELKK